jgi:hypothetical protein
MTNYYTHVSFEVRLNSKAVAWLETYMDLYGNRIPIPPYDELGCIFEINEGKMTLWVHGDEVNVDGLAEVLQAMLVGCKAVKYIAFECALTAGRPVLDAFGGGVCWITKDDIEFMSTGEWIRARGVA